MPAVFKYFFFGYDRKTFGLRRCSCNSRALMRRFAVMIGLLWAVGSAFCADADFELTAKDGFLGFNTKERKFTASIESAPLKTVMAKVGAATGWKVYIDPAAHR